MEAASWRMKCFKPPLHKLVATCGKHKSQTTGCQYCMSNQSFNFKCVSKRNSTTRQRRASGFQPNFAAGIRATSSGEHLGWGILEVCRFCWCAKSWRPLGKPNQKCLYSLEIPIWFSKLTMSILSTCQWTLILPPLISFKLQVCDFTDPARPGEWGAAKRGFQAQGWTEMWSHAITTWAQQATME